jgi:phosphatidylinositol 3-kinase
MQLIGLMDKALKRLNLDLRLTPFKVLATGSTDGIMQVH